MLNNKMENVLVFIPPPVEPGDAPMNMRIRIMNKEALHKLFISTVLNPAVLGVIELKIDTTIFSVKVKPLSV
jgi:hypothetical protein